MPMRPCLVACALLVATVIVLRLFGNTAALQANLLSRDINIDSYFTVDQVLALKIREPDRFNYYTFPPSLTYTHIDMQKDFLLCRTCVYGMRYQCPSSARHLTPRCLAAYIQCSVASSTRGGEHYDPNISTVPYAPAGARKLLAEAGWTPGSDGVCRNAAGDHLSLEFLSTASMRYRELEVAVIQNG